MSAPTPLHLFTRDDGGPVCALCGAVPSTPELDQEARLRGFTAELVIYSFRIDSEFGSRLYIGWVCPGSIHGNLGDPAAEGERLGLFHPQRAATA